MFHYDISIMKKKTKFDVRLAKRLWDNIPKMALASLKILVQEHGLSIANATSAARAGTARKTLAPPCSSGVLLSKHWVRISGRKIRQWPFIVNGQLIRSSHCTTSSATA